MNTHPADTLLLEHGAAGGEARLAVLRLLLHLLLHLALLCLEGLLAGVLGGPALGGGEGELDAVLLGAVGALQDAELLGGGHALDAARRGLVLQLLHLRGLLATVRREGLDRVLDGGVEALGEREKLVEELGPDARDADAVAAQVLLWLRVRALVVLLQNHDLVVEQQVLDEGNAAVIVKIDVRELLVALRRRAGLAVRLQEASGLDGVQALS
mmetsp:Transcript_14221/g.42567  ORF Transcript_14221/g.42567 Transcript_14221/m.42567 type:complete len:213 (+) Transcript_14221:1498-2136(+)